MVKRLSGWILERLIGLFDRNPDQGDIRAFIERHYTRLWGKKNLPEECMHDLVRLERLLVELGWESPGLEEAASEKRTEESHPEQFAHLRDKEVFGLEGLQPGCGQYLDKLDQSAKNNERAVAADIMERLLRHVEVRREKSLSKFCAGISEEQQWMERYDISILFSRTARRHHDLRFLNAALKMNEWYLGRINSSAPNERLARLLLALAEQELSAREMLA